MVKNIYMLKNTLCSWKFYDRLSKNAMKKSDSHTVNGSHHWHISTWHCLLKALSGSTYGSNGRAATSYQNFFKACLYTKWLVLLKTSGESERKQSLQANTQHWMHHTQQMWFTLTLSCPPNKLAISGKSSWIFLGLITTLQVQYWLWFLLTTLLNIRYL